MKETLKHFGTGILLSACTLLGSIAAANANAQTCEGRIFLKGGGQQLYTGEDRIELPRKMRDVETYRHFFSHQCQRSIVPVDSVDSVAVWNADAPQNVRILVPVKDVGWCWLYVDNPRIHVYIYSSQGYSLNALGGMKAWQGNTVAAMFLIPSKTSCDFYVARPGEKPMCIGDVYKRCDKAFIRKLCRCAGIEADKEQMLLKSGEIDRSAMVQMVVALLSEQ